MTKGLCIVIVVFGMAAMGCVEPDPCVEPYSCPEPGGKYCIDSDDEQTCWINCRPPVDVSENSPCAGECGEWVLQHCPNVHLAR